MAQTQFESNSVTKVTDGLEVRLVQVPDIRKVFIRSNGDLVRAY
jgi:hypothetical protein